MDTQTNAAKNTQYLLCKHYYCAVKWCHLTCVFRGYFWLLLKVTAAYHCVYELVICRLTAKKLGSTRSPTLIIEYETTYTLAVLPVRSVILALHCIACCFVLYCFVMLFSALCWIVWHNVHSPQHTYISSSCRSNRLGLSHWDPYAVRRGGCLEL